MPFADGAALTMHTEQDVQHLISHFSLAYKTNVMDIPVSPSTNISNIVLEVTEYVM